MAAGTRRAECYYVKLLLLENLKGCAATMSAIQAGGRRNSRMSKLLQLPCGHSMLIVQKGVPHK